MKDREVHAIGGLNLVQGMVKEFQEEKGVGETLHFPLKERETRRLYEVSEQLHNMVKYLSERSFVEMRASLIIEELGELLWALDRNDENLVLDALADLLYVVVALAENLQMPLALGFLEVHRSNMTKQVASGDKRLKDKGPDYIPPNMANVIELARQTPPVSNPDLQKWLGIFAPEYKGKINVDQQSDEK